MARMSTELLNDKGDYLQQQKQLNPTTIALGTYGEADRSNECEIRTQRALKELLFNDNLGQFGCQLVSIQG